MKNQYVEITFGTKNITCDDLTDKNNEPCFFTKSKRGITKLAQMMKEKFNEKTTIWNCMEMCDMCKVKYHYFCRMD